jgi:hypothetical protein
MKAVASVVCLLLLTATLRAQDSAQRAPDDERNGAAVGWEISSFANNYAFGARLDTPRFARRTVHVQIGASLAWVQGVPLGESDTTWAPYTLLRIGIVRSTPIGSLPLRFYGGGGLALVLPTNDVSGQSAQGGGYGLTGLELSVPENGGARWFVEVGGMGTGAKADRLANSPIYANGFTIGWGFRYRL